jgi:prepilin-type N-terminal cleavage/methylation domain-containing protein
MRTVNKISAKFSDRANRAGRANRGFTLVEVLVVIAITALLAGLILTYSSQSRDQVALFVEQAKLAQTFARAKSLTVSIYTQNPADSPCGYGVSMDYADNTYTLFAYDPDEDVNTCRNIQTLNDLFQTEIITERLPGNLVLAEPDAESVGGLLFLPPNPETNIWIEGQNSTSTEGRVRLESRSGEDAVEVTVTSAGQITF